MSGKSIYGDGDEVQKDNAGPLFAQADAARDKGMAQAEENAHEAWKATAYATVRWLAKNRSAFTSEDVLKVMAKDFPELTTHDTRALGPVMKRAQKAGVIQPTSDFVKGTRSSRHGAFIRVWRRA